MIVWVVSNPYHSMAIPWVVSMNIASEKKCVSQCYKVGEGSILVSMYFCVFQESVPISSKMGEMGKAWRAEVSILRGVGEGHCV